MKKHIVAELRSGWPELSDTAAGDVVDRVARAIEATVRAHGEASIPDFGKFKAKHRASRTVRNPRTGEVVKTSEKTVPVFKASSKFTL